MSLWLYSSGDGPSNVAIDRELVCRLGTPKPRMTFIASSQMEAPYYFSEFCERFGLHGVRDCNLFLVDKPFSDRQLRQALKANLVYLSGGNTFYFLKHLKSSGAAREIIAFYKSGGHLGGTSAGAIILTRSIKTAGYPDFDRDDNTVGISDFRALGLARFEFFPHYGGKEIYSEELAYQSTQISHPLYAVPDGGGIVVDSERLTFYGKITGFLRGIRFKIGG